MSDGQDHLDDDLRALLNKWGSEGVIYRFLDSEAKRVNRRCFGGRLILPAIQVKPEWLSRGLLGGGHAGADYEPAADGREATVGMFASTLLDQDRAKRALTHELVHHWEHTIGRARRATAYPKEIDAVIVSRFSKPERAARWRSGHSTRFIAKLWSVATLLDEPIDGFLFG
jgi:hypothetical protein